MHTKANLTGLGNQISPEKSYLHISSCDPRNKCLNYSLKKTQIVERNCIIEIF